MKLLLITPYYPYPAEKTGGVHTINMILNNLSNYEIDIFYYGEDENKNYKFNNQIKNVYYEDLRNKKKYSRLKSLLIGKTYSSYMYNKDSDVLNSILSSNIYDVIIYDQYSSMDFNIKTNTSKCNYLFMHDSYPMLFERKGKMANIVGRIYYKLQYIYSIKEEIREIPVNMKRESLPLQGTLRTGAHVRNTPNARRRTGEHDEKATAREGRGAAFEADPAMLGLYRPDLNRNEAQGKHGRGKDSRNSWSGSETGHLFLWPPLPDVEGRRNPPVLPI